MKMNKALTNEQKAAEYYRLAYQCAEHKRNGCQGYCGNCQFNVQLYIADPREAVLIRTSAAIDEQKIYEQKKDEENTKLVGVIILMVTCLFLWYKCSTPAQKSISVTQKEPEYTMPVQTVAVNTEVNPSFANPKPPEKIKDKSISTVCETVRVKIRDMDGDGQVNCVDYATLFYIEYGPGCRIIRNINPQTGMNHLFNQVTYNDGRSFMIEPQNGHLIRMERVWGSKYDPKYNCDETEYWVAQVK
jgi:hypothetical protein